MGSGDYVLPRYMGNKQRIADWIVERLPRREVYVEAFAGTCRVLLARAPGGFEIVNDLDDNIWAWWKAVRDHPTELAERLAATPHSVAAHDEALQLLRRGDEIDVVVRAAAVATYLTMSYRSTLDLYCKGQEWTWTSPSPGRWPKLSTRLAALAERMADVRLERRDAVDVIAAYGRRPNTTIYCDPPYGDGVRGYHADVDYEAMATALRGCEAAVAVSGYPGCPWTDLLDDWHVATTERPQALARQGKTDNRVTECLWLNFAPPNQLPFGG